MENEVHCCTCYCDWGPGWVTAGGTVLGQLGGGIPGQAYVKEDIRESSEVRQSTK